VLFRSIESDITPPIVHTIAL